MAKHSMRGFYVIGALLLGIILLYIVIRNVEPFKPQETIVNIHFKIDKSNRISDVTSSNQSIVSLNTIGTNSLSLKINPQYILTNTNIKNNIEVESISNINCNRITSKRIPNTKLCTVKVDNRGKTTIASKLQGNIFTITGIIKDENTGLPDTTIEKSTNTSGSNMPPGANIRITLKLTKK
jgi:hypothetical protein